jgi:hypothetical protein
MDRIRCPASPQVEMRLVFKNGILERFLERCNWPTGQTATGLELSARCVYNISVRGAGIGKERRETLTNPKRRVSVPPDPRTHDQRRSLLRFLTHFGLFPLVDSSSFCWPFTRKVNATAIMPYTTPTPRRFHEQSYDEIARPGLGT